MRIADCGMKELPKPALVRHGVLELTPFLSRDREGAIRPIWSAARLGGLPLSLAGSLLPPLSRDRQGAVRSGYGARWPATAFLGHDLARPGSPASGRRVGKRRQVAALE